VYTNSLFLLLPELFAKLFLCHRFPAFFKLRRLFQTVHIFFFLPPFPRDTRTPWTRRLEPLFSLAFSFFKRIDSSFLSFRKIPPLENEFHQPPLGFFLVDRPIGRIGFLFFPRYCALQRRWSFSRRFFDVQVFAIAFGNVKAFIFLHTFTVGQSGCKLLDFFDSCPHVLVLFLNPHQYIFSFFFSSKVPPDSWADVRVSSAPLEPLLRLSPVVFSRPALAGSRKPVFLFPLIQSGPGRTGFSFSLSSPARLTSSVPVVLISRMALLQCV